MKILALHLYHFIEYAQQRGVTEQDVRGVMKNAPVDFQDTTAMVEPDDFYAALKSICDVVDDPLLGIRAGDFLSLKSLGLIYQISLQNTSIEEALLYLQTYLQATFPVVTMWADTEGDEARITLRIAEGDSTSDRIILENILTVVSRELRMMAGDSLSYAIQSPQFDSAYPRHWTAGEYYSIVFTKAVLKARLQDKSRWQLDILIPAYLKMIEGLKLDRSFTNQVKIAILNLAKPELPELDTIADNFNMTARTFQRRLDSEKTTFRKITDELKKQISYLLLRHDRFSISDISYVLGYSEPASFIHTFKKWYGNSPEKMRQQADLHKLDFKS
jgi:AraC-like DNA-binding protein